MKISIINVMALLLVIGMALGWYTDRRRLTTTLSEIRNERLQFGLAHQDERVRRQFVLSLIRKDSLENVPALIDALRDGDIRIALEARAGLEVITGVSFRRKLSNSGDPDAILIAMEEEHVAWQTSSG